MLSENKRHELHEGLRRYLDAGTVALLRAQLFAATTAVITTMT